MARRAPFPGYPLPARLGFISIWSSSQALTAAARSLSASVGETAGLEDDGAQFGNGAATGVIEVHERKTRARHRILQERDRQRRWQVMLPAQMQERAD
jgi:hypothetical protein